MEKHFPIKIKGNNNFFLFIISKYIFWIKKKKLEWMPSIKWVKGRKLFLLWDIDSMCDKVLLFFNIHFVPQFSNINLINWIVWFTGKNILYCGKSSTLKIKNIENFYYSKKVYINKIWEIKNGMQNKIVKLIFPWRQFFFLMQI